MTYLCGSFSEFRTGASVHENRHEAERKVGHLIHHRTYRWTETWFASAGPRFLNISLQGAREMLNFRGLNLGGHLTSDSCHPKHTCDILKSLL